MSMTLTPNDLWYDPRPRPAQRSGRDAGMLARQHLIDRAARDRHLPAKMAMMFALAGLLVFMFGFILRDGRPANGLTFASPLPFVSPLNGATVAEYRTVGKPIVPATSKKQKRASAVDTASVAAVTPMPTATPAVTVSLPVAPLPSWVLTDDCQYRMLRILAGEVGSVDDQETSNFVAQGILRTALNTHCTTNPSKLYPTTMEQVWFGWRRFVGTGTAPIIDDKSRNALKYAMQHWQTSEPYDYIGSQDDIRLWLVDRDCYIAAAVPAYNPDRPKRIPVEFGVKCVRGK